jgi:hypothetical protein
MLLTRGAKQRGREEKRRHVIDQNYKRTERRVNKNGDKSDARERIVMPVQAFTCPFHGNSTINDKLKKKKPRNTNKIK